MPYLRGEYGIKTIRCRIYDPFADTHRVRGHFKRVISEFRKLERKESENIPLADADLVNLEIRDRDDLLRLKVRNENLYLHGYQTREGRVWEMRDTDDEEKIMLRDSFALGFDENYWGLEDLNLSYWAFTESVKELIRNENPNQAHNIIRKSLFQIVMMIIESSRSHWLDEFYTAEIRRMDTNVQFVMPWMDNMVHGWSKGTKLAKKCKKGKVCLNKE